MEESASTTTTTATTSSSCASPQTDSSSVSASPATEASNQQFRFQMQDKSVSAIEEALKTEKEFIEYVMTLPATRMDREVEETFQNQTNRTNSVRLVEGNRKVGLDHLNNLCKLMEQLSGLRESNVKLKRRVQYLEESKPLSKIHRDYAFPLMTKDDMAIVKTRASNDAYKSHTLATMSHIQKDNRERSKSAGTTELSYTKSKRKFPKWSKWKEALGLDRSNQFEIKRDKDNHGKITTGERCRELELPTYEDKAERNDVSPARSLPDRNWCSGAMLQSSSDDVTGLFYETSEQNTSWEQNGQQGFSACLSDPEIQQDHQKRKRKSSSDIPEGNLIKGQRKKSTPPEQGELEDDLKKSTKTPWGRMKTIIQTRRDNVKQIKQKPQHRNNDRASKGDEPTLDGVHLDNGKEINHDSDAVAIETEHTKHKDRKFSLEQINKTAIKDTLSRSISNDVASSSGQVSNLVQELQRNLSQDFSKKLEEWEKIKAKSSKSECKDTLPKRGKSKKFEREEKSFRQRVKDINWLEKELQKVESETQRVAKEKQKCEKRALRLQGLKEAMLNGSNKKEVFVRTSAGEFRFEGISDAFTKKLYEWETKQGVGPEFSTIALLDSCVMPKSQAGERAPLKKGYSRSETSIPDASPTSPTSSPCFKHSSSSGKSTRTQLSRSNTEPDLLLYSGQKDNVEQHASSYSTDLLCSDSSTFLQQSEVQEQMGDLDDHRETANFESNYCSLLEDNMYLLENLRNKEEICRRLQGELEALDDRTELMAKKHQDEMERYREKLWEIHRPGRKPRDLQSSLKLISCLKTRIEELQRCSEKLKLDRETLEDSFRYHSEQQARLADGLAEKMKELQEAGWSSASGTENEADRRRGHKRISCDSEIIEKLSDLSTQLLQQAREVDKTLAERSRQVCHLRWELLHRDVSMMLLQTEVHRSKWQNVAAGVRRAKFRQKRSWSSSERLYPKERDDSEAEEWLQTRLKNLSSTTYSDWPKVDYGPSELVWTIHEMKKAILRLSANSTVEQPIDAAGEEQEAPCREECEVTGSDKYDLGSVLNSRSSSFSSEMSSQFCSSRPDSRLYESGRACGQRRNSLGNLSSMSGADISDSSSVNEPEKSAPCLLRLPWKTWRSKDNVSTSSDSSLLDDDSVTTSWYHARRYEYSGDEKYSDDDLWSRELNIQFTSLNEEDEESSAASREDPKIVKNVTPSSSFGAKHDQKVEKLMMRNEEPSQIKFNESSNENPELDRRSSDSSNEIVISKLTDTNSVKNLKVRTSSFVDLLNPKQSVKTSVSPVGIIPKVVATEPSADGVGKTPIYSDTVAKASPILPTYVQCLNISDSGISSLVSSKIEKSSKCDPQDSSNLTTSKSIPSVTVATQKVKLSYYNGSSSKVSQTSEGCAHDTKTCSTATANSIVAEQTDNSQLHRLQTEYSQQCNATCSTTNAIEEIADYSNCVSKSRSANEPRSLRAFDFSKLQKNKEQLADRRNAFCKQTVLNLNNPMVKTIGNSSPSQSPTSSSPETDLSTRPKTAWLPLNIFRQK